MYNINSFIGKITCKDSWNIFLPAARYEHAGLQVIFVSFSWGKKAFQGNDLKKALEYK